MTTPLNPKHNGNDPKPEIPIDQWVARYSVKVSELLGVTLAQGKEIAQSVIESDADAVKELTPEEAAENEADAWMQSQ